jgi:non-ribosomal peptide synthetase component F
MVDMHHIISDGVSRRVLERDFTALYLEGELLPLKIQYKDFSEWQNSETQRGVMKQQEAYWLNRFADEVPVLNLPTDFQRQAIRRFEGSRVRFVMGKEETKVLREIARSEGVTMFMVLIALYNVLLSKLSGQENIVIGSVVAGRRHTDLEQIMGMFVNTLVLKNHPQKEKTFPEFLQDVKKGALEAFENQDYQLEDLVDKLVVKRDPSRNPLFDVMFALQTRDAPVHENVEEEPEREIPYTQRQHELYERRTAKADLLFNGIDEGETVVFSIEYNTDLFKQETIQRYADYYKEIAGAVTKNKEIKLKEIKISIDLIEKQLDNPDINFGF